MKHEAALCYFGRFGGLAKKIDAPVMCVTDYFFVAFPLLFAFLDGDE